MVTVEEIYKYFESESDLEGIFRLLKATQMASDRKFQERLIMCQYQHNRIRSDYKRGIISYSESHTYIMRISEELLSMCREIPQVPIENLVNEGPQERNLSEKAALIMSISVNEGKKIFEQFKEYSNREKQTIIDYYFFDSDSTSYIKIDEDHYNSLDHTDRSKVSIRPREFLDAIWNTMKDEDGSLESCVLVKYDEKQNKVVITSDIVWPYTINHAHKIISWFSRSRRWLEGELVCNMGS